MQPAQEQNDSPNAESDGPQRSRGQFGKIVGFAVAWTTFSALVDRSNRPESVTPDSTPDPYVHRISEDELQSLPAFNDHWDLSSANNLPLPPFQNEFESSPFPTYQEYQPFENRVYPGAGLNLDSLPGAFQYDTPSIEELVQILETSRTELVKNALVTQEGRLKPGVAEQLRVIVDRQNQPDVNWEVFGVIDANDEHATLSIVKTGYSVKLAHTLEAFSKGDNSQIDVLLQAISDFKKIHGTYLEESDGPMILATAIEQTLASHSSEDDFISKNIRDLIVETFRDFITDGFTVVSGEDIPEELKEFEAIFHVHPNGSDPSPPDLAANKGDHMPDLVISPQESGDVRLHLVHHGAVELLYEGPIR